LLFCNQIILESLRCYILKHNGRGKRESELLLKVKKI
jgi:hypothetical protein